MTLGLEVFVHEVMAAITTAPWRRSARSPLLPTRAAAWRAASSSP